MASVLYRDAKVGTAVLFTSALVTPATITPAPPSTEPTTIMFGGTGDRREVNRFAKMFAEADKPRKKKRKKPAPVLPMLPSEPLRLETAQSFAAPSLNLTDILAPQHYMPPSLPRADIRRLAVAFKALPPFTKKTP